jgi:hypothetical protein
MADEDEEAFAAIQQQVTSLKEKIAQVFSESDRESQETMLKKLKVDLNELQDLFNLHFQSLPTYDLQRTQEAIASLSEDILKAETKLTPKQKFSFRSNKTSGAAPKPAEPSPVDHVDRSLSLPHPPQRVISERRILFQGISSRDSLNFHHFSRCTLVISEQVTSIHFRALTNCTILAGTQQHSFIIVVLIEYFFFVFFSPCHFVHYGARMHELHFRRRRASNTSSRHHKHRVLSCSTWPTDCGKLLGTAFRTIWLYV